MNQKILLRGTIGFIPKREITSRNDDKKRNSVPLQTENKVLFAM